jgi:hypothetical protein
LELSAGAAGRALKKSKRVTEVPFVDEEAFDDFFFCFMMFNVNVLVISYVGRI